MEESDKENNSIDIVNISRTPSKKEYATSDEKSNNVNVKINLPRDMKVEDEQVVASMLEDVHVVQETEAAPSAPDGDDEQTEEDSNHDAATTLTSLHRVSKVNSKCWNGAKFLHVLSSLGIDDHIDHSDYSDYVMSADHSYRDADDTTDASEAIKESEDDDTSGSGMNSDEETDGEKIEMNGDDGSNNSGTSSVVEEPESDSSRNVGSSGPQPCWEKRFASLLDNIGHKGKFCSRMKVLNGYPLASVDGLDDEDEVLAYPIQRYQVDRLCQIAEKATTADDDTKAESSVIARSARSHVWAVDSSKVKVADSDNWMASFHEVVQECSHELGISKKVATTCVNVKLDKLLVYKPADDRYFKLNNTEFFVASEEEDGVVFGTLLIQLPSKYEGGAIRVRHKGELNNEEMDDDISVEIRQQRCYATAFYADCDVDIDPLYSGHKLCLVYKLVLQPGSPASCIPSELGLDAFAHELQALSSEWKDDDDESKLMMKGYALDHEYTEQNLSFSELKGRDKQIIDYIQSAKDHDGQPLFVAMLALLKKKEYGLAMRRRDHSYQVESVGSRTFHVMNPSSISNIRYSCQHLVDLDNYVHDTPPFFQVNEGYLLNFDQDLEGLFRLPAEEHLGGSMCDDYLQLSYYRGAVVFWPRTQNVRVSLSSGPSYVALCLRSTTDARDSQAFVQEVLQGLIKAETVLTGDLLAALLPFDNIDEELARAIQKTKRIAFTDRSFARQLAATMTKKKSIHIDQAATHLIASTVATGIGRRERSDLDAVYEVISFITQSGDSLRSKETFIAFVEAAMSNSDIAGGALLAIASSLTDNNKHPVTPDEMEDAMIRLLEVSKPSTATTSQLLPLLSKYGNPSLIVHAVKHCKNIDSQNFAKALALAMIEIQNEDVDQTVYRLIEATAAELATTKRDTFIARYATKGNIISVMKCVAFLQKRGDHRRAVASFRSFVDVAVSNEHSLRYSLPYLVDCLVAMRASHKQAQEQLAELVLPVLIKSGQAPTGDVLRSLVRLRNPKLFAQSVGMLNVGWDPVEVKILVKAMAEMKSRQAQSAICLWIKENSSAMYVPPGKRPRPRRYSRFEVVNFWLKALADIRNKGDETGLNNALCSFVEGAMENEHVVEIALYIAVKILSLCTKAQPSEEGTSSFAMVRDLIIAFACKSIRSMKAIPNCGPVTIQANATNLVSLTIQLADSNVEEACLDLIKKSAAYEKSLLAAHQATEIMKGMGRLDLWGKCFSAFIDAALSERSTSVECSQGISVVAEEIFFRRPTLLPLFIHRVITNASPKAKAKIVDFLERMKGAIRNDHVRRLIKVRLDELDTPIEHFSWRDPTATKKLHNRYCPVTMFLHDPRRAVHRHDKSFSRLAEAREWAKCRAHRYPNVNLIACGSGRYSFVQMEKIKSKFVRLEREHLSKLLQRGASSSSLPASASNENKKGAEEEKSASEKRSSPPSASDRQKKKPKLGSGSSYSPIVLD